MQMPPNMGRGEKAGRKELREKTEAVSLLHMPNHSPKGTRLHKAQNVILNRHRTYMTECSKTTKPVTKKGENKYGLCYYLRHQKAILSH